MFKELRSLKLSTPLLTCINICLGIYYGQSFLKIRAKQIKKQNAKRNKKGC